MSPSVCARLSSSKHELYVCCKDVLEGCADKFGSSRELALGLDAEGLCKQRTQDVRPKFALG